MWHRKRIASRPAMHAAFLWRADASRHALARGHVGIERAARLGIAAPLRELLDPPDADAAIERSGDHITNLERMARCGDTAAVDPDPTAAHEACRRSSCLDDPRMPQPLVDALPIH